MSIEDEDELFYDAGEDSVENGWHMHLGPTSPSHVNTHHHIAAGHGITLPIGHHSVAKRLRPRPRPAHTCVKSHIGHSGANPTFCNDVEHQNGVLCCHAGHGGEIPSQERFQNESSLGHHRLSTGLQSQHLVPAKYELAQDLYYADRVPDAEISIIKIAREVIGGIKHGADVTNVNLPASVLDPVSSLEKGMKSMQRGELMQEVVREQDSYRRFLALVRFYLSGLSKEKFGKKPYNPILGEVFRACFAHRDNGGHTVLVAEQVSHHPPISALHLCNETLGFHMNSHAAPEPRFWGNSVEVKLNGIIRINLEKFANEEYELTRPSLHMSGFLAGRHRIEFVGPTIVRCVATGLCADFEFKTKGMLARGELNAVSGRIFELQSGKTLATLAGTWDGVITIRHETGGSAVLYDYDSIVRGYSMCAILPPISERESTFSSVVWAECSKWIWKSDTLNANAAKRKIEDEQRQLRKERELAGVRWESIYFENRKDGKEGYVLRDGLRQLLRPVVSLSAEDADVVERTQRSTDPDSITMHNEVEGSRHGRMQRKKLAGLARGKKTNTQ